MRPIPEQTVLITGATDGLGKAVATELAGFLLIRLLPPTLRASAPARIVQVSSAGQSPIDFYDVMPTKIVATPVSTLQSGVDATLRLVLSRALDGVSGRYYNGQRQVRAHNAPKTEETSSRPHSVS